MNSFIFNICFFISFYLGLKKNFEFFYFNKSKKKKFLLEKKEFNRSFSKNGYKEYIINENKFKKY
jgi:hypothetical protein